MTTESLDIVVRVIAYLVVGLILMPLAVRVFEMSDFLDSGDFDDMFVLGTFVLIWPVITAGSVAVALFYGLSRAVAWVVQASGPGWGPKAGTVAPLTRGEIVAELGAIADVLAGGDEFEAHDRIVRLWTRAAGAAALGPGIGED